MNNRKEYFRQYRLAHLEDYNRRSKEFQERRRQGIEIQDKYYTTREELKEAEERAEGRINWDVWQSLVEKTKQELASITFPKQNNGIPKWVYQASTGKLIGHYENTQEVLDAFPQLNLTRAAVNYYAMTGKPYYKLDLFFSNEPIILQPRTKKEARLTAAYDLNTNQLIALFQTASEAEEYFNMPSAQVSYCIRQHNGVYKKKNLRFEYQSKNKKQ